MRHPSIDTGVRVHRAAIGLGLLFITISGLAAASPAPQPRPYSLSFTVSMPAANQLTFDATVVDNATKQAIMQPRLTTQRGVQGQASSKLGDGREVSVRMRGQTLGDAEALLEVRQNGNLVQRTLYMLSDETYDGELITLNLKGADIHDVLSTLGDLTDLTFDVDAGVKASVNIDVRDVPWDKALEDMLNDHGLMSQVDGKTIHVRNKR